MKRITLSDRPPVSIEEDDWLELASASDQEHDGKVECQANRRSHWALTVLLHKDGRAIVYATYSHTSRWEGARCHQARHGVLLTGAGGPTAIVAAIHRTRERMQSCEHAGDDALRWTALADDCIANLPAEVI